MSTSKKIQVILDILIKSNLLKKIVYNREFFDEPNLNKYSCFLNSNKKYTDGNEDFIDSGGFSYKSRSLGLLKCLSEAVERFSCASFRSNKFIYSSYNQLQPPALDPYLYIKQASVREKIFSWYIGFDLLNNKDCFVPAQVLFFYSFRVKNESLLTTQISTGASAGFEHNLTLLRGIYEIFERDAFMTTYLLKYQAPLIDLRKLKDNQILVLTSYAERYRLKLLTFDITNDLEVPTFLAIVLDQTGIGPIITLGLKSSFDISEAIVGSIEEAFHSRPWLRKEILKGKTRIISTPASKVRNLRDRGLFWLNPKKLVSLSFLLKQVPKPLNKSYSKTAPIDQLNTIKSILRKKGYSLYYSDLTSELFKEVPIRVYKVIIPELQPLYMSESKKEIRLVRLKQVADFFKISYNSPNSVPHPFL